MNKINLWRNEKSQLTNFLNERGYNIHQIGKELIPQYFSGFIYALAEMGKTLKQAELTARFMKDFQLTGEILGKAGIQKDEVYDNLTLALGTPTTQFDLGGGRSINTIDVSKGGLNCLDRVWEEPQLRVLRDYVMDRFHEGLNKCERILLS